MTGGCLCGGVRYRVLGSPLYAGHCHCRDCQRVTGAGHATGAGFRKHDVEITGTLSVFASRGASGCEVRRYFCPTCSSMIASESDAGPGILSLYAGTLDDPSQLAPRFALYSKDRPAWDFMAEDIKRHETAPHVSAASSRDQVDPDGGKD